jgi:hypothetical protein
MEQLAGASIGRPSMLSLTITQSRIERLTARWRSRRESHIQPSIVELFAKGAKNAMLKALASVAAANASVVDEIGGGVGLLVWRSRQSIGLRRMRGNCSLSLPPILKPRETDGLCADFHEMDRGGMFVLVTHLALSPFGLLSLTTFIGSPLMLFVPPIRGVFIVNASIRLAESDDIYWWFAYVVRTTY